MTSSIIARHLASWSREVWAGRWGEGRVGGGGGRGGRRRRGVGGREEGKGRRWVSAERMAACVLGQR